MNKLFQLTQLAKTNKKQAEQELLVFTRSLFPKLRIESVCIQMSSVSLNSTNGVITIAGKEYFFKFHTEQGEEKTLHEYYRSEQLASHGFPMLMPLYKSLTAGKQFLIYPKINTPTAFALLDSLDRQYLKTKRYNSGLKKKILACEKKAMQQQLKLYIKNLKVAPAKLVAKDPLNQLFYVRLADQRTTPRVQLFYQHKTVCLPRGKTINFDELKKYTWKINGTIYQETLGQLINEATRLLNPKRLAHYPVVLGHGDDHNGNKFVTRRGYLYFDAAFASEHQYALLSPIKTTFHDCFAHPLWLYDPADFPLHIDYKINRQTMMVETNFSWEKQAPIRKQVLAIKLQELWIPLLTILKQKNLLEPDWKNFIRKALFACPFLVYNLIDTARYTPEKSLFALSQAISVGSLSGIVEPYLTQIEEHIV